MSKASNLETQRQEIRDRDYKGEDVFNLKIEFNMVISYHNLNGIEKYNWLAA